MIEIKQITTLRAKLFFDLAGDPLSSVAHGMQVSRLAETGTPGTIEERPPCRPDIPLQGATVAQDPAALGVRKANLGFFPGQRLPFAPVFPGRVRRHDRHPPAIPFGHHRRTARLLRPALTEFTGLQSLLSRAFGHPADRALAQQYAVMFDQLIHRLGKRHVRSKVRDHPLQRARTASVANLGATCEGRPNSLAARAKLRFFYTDFAKGAVPAQFFLPSRQTPRASPRAAAVFSTCPRVHASSDSRPIWRISCQRPAYTSHSMIGIFEPVRDRHIGASR